MNPIYFYITNKLTFKTWLKFIILPITYFIKITDLRKKEAFISSTLKSFLSAVWIQSIILDMSNKDDDFDIAPPENVGTEIIDPKMPSNLDF